MNTVQKGHLGRRGSGFTCGLFRSTSWLLCYIVWLNISKQLSYRRQSFPVGSKRKADSNGKTKTTYKFKQGCWFVSWSLTTLFSTNMAISETKGQGWKSTRLLVWAYSQSDNGLFSRTPGTRKVKPLWILMKQDMMGWQWIQLDHMQIICTSLQTDNPIFHRLFSSSKHVPGSVNYKF